MTPWTVARQAPLSVGFSRQEYWSGLPWGSIFLLRAIRNLLSYQKKKKSIFDYSACGILVSQSGIEPTSPTLEGQSLNHWTNRKSPETSEILSKEGCVHICILQILQLQCGLKEMCGQTDRSSHCIIYLRMGNGAVLRESRAQTGHVFRKVR